MTGSELFERKIWNEISDWKKNHSEKYALLIEGPRRVGKSTVAEQFAKQNYRSYILVDFSKDVKDVEDIISGYSGDLGRFFIQLQRLMKKELYERDSVIIFDEVQLFPKARQMIKHLVADGRYDYIETGSLISIKQNVKDILIPSEEMSVQMHPMDFEEFLWAVGDKITFREIRRSFEERVAMGQKYHRQVMNQYLLYMLIGGMPQVVSTYIEKNSFRAIETSKKEILNLYIKDAEKIRGDRSGKCKRIMSLIPSMLSRHDKSFKAADVRKNSRIRDYLDSVYALADSKMVNICYRCTDPNPALNLNIDDSDFKLYQADTGLLFTSAFMSNIGDIDEIYDSIFKGKLNINKGMFFENMVAQELVAAGRPLVFGKFEDTITGKQQEVDFIIADGGKIMPVEVKSAVSGRHASLDRFMEKYASRIDHAYVIHGKDFRTDGNITYIPIYMTELI